MSVKYFGSDALNKLIDLVKTALGLKADDSNVVHKTGDETVGGIKTFSDTTNLNNGWAGPASTGTDTPLRIAGNATGSYVAFTNNLKNTTFGYFGVKNDNKPYFYDSSAKRLALLEETAKKIDNASVGWITGAGSYNYCLLATITITSNYVNYPTLFRIWGRGYAQTNLQIRFKSVNSTDPDLDAFVTDNSDQFRLYKSATSTWQLYGVYSDSPWGAYGIDRVIGPSVNAGITVTINCTNVSSIPSGASAPILRVGWDGSAGINGGIDPDHCDYLATMKNTGTWENGINISQGVNETSGIHMDGASIKMWSPCDNGSLIYYDEDNGNEVWRVDNEGCLVGGMVDPSATSNKVWFGKDSNGKWGYKTSKTGTVTPFRNPTGTATAGKVLRGYTFSNATSDGISGTYDPLLEAYDPSDTSFTNYYVPKNSTYDITVPTNYILIIQKSTSLSIGVVTSGTAGLIKEYSNSIYVYVSYSSNCKIRLTNNYSYAYNIIYAILRIT